jgi:hypothetical protein
MAPVQRYGTGWGPNLGRQPPGASPPPALPSPTCWAVSGDYCSSERRRPGSSAWTYCSQNCQVSSLRWKFQVGRNFKFELINSCLSLAHIQSFSPSWPLGSCRLARIVPRTGSQTVTQVSPGVRRADSDSLSVWLSLIPAVTDRWQLCSSVVSLSSCTSLHER